MYLITECFSRAEIHPSASLFVEIRMAKAKMIGE